MIVLLIIIGIICASLIAVIFGVHYFLDNIWPKLCDFVAIVVDSVGQHPKFWLTITVVYVVFHCFKWERCERVLWGIAAVGLIVCVGRTGKRR